MTPTSDHPDRRKEALAALQEFSTAMYRLSGTWTQLVDEHPDDEIVMSDEYPFNASFDDLCEAAARWVEHVRDNLGKPTPDLPAKSRREYLTPAEPGQVWLLRLQYSPRSGNGAGYVQPVIDITPYVDPRTAIKDLAKHVRDEWPFHAAGRPYPPGTAPADDLEAIAVFYANPTPEGTPYHDRFDLEKVDVVTKRTPVPVGGPERVLMEPYGELACYCGNDSMGNGFIVSDAYGRLLTGAAANGEHLTCWTCGRVIETSSGRVVTRLPLCEHCGTPIVLVPLLSRRGDKAAGDLIWKHATDQGEEHIRCADAHHVSHDGEATPNV